MIKNLITLLIAGLLVVGCTLGQINLPPATATTPDNLNTPADPGAADMATGLARAETESPDPGHAEAIATAAARPPREQPTSRLEFASLAEAGQMSSFPIVTPDYVPDDLPLPIIVSHVYADGHEEWYLYYSRPAKTAAVSDRLLVVVLSNAIEPVSRENLNPPERTAALDVQEVSFGGQTGFTYWSPSATMGNSAHLEWRAGELNMHLVLFGDWPAPDEGQPHLLDDLLLRIAASFQSAS